MKELWLPLPEWEGLYEASDQGRVLSLPRRVRGALRRARIMKPSLLKDGYQKYTLCREGYKRSFRAHQLILLTFKGPRPDGMECRHLNGIPTDNRLVNLAYGTKLDNVRDRFRHGNVVSGERHPRSILTDQQRLDIKHAYHVDHIPIAELARMYGVSYRVVWGSVHYNRKFDVPGA